MPRAPQVLVFGRRGQVARDLEVLGEMSGVDLIFAGRDVCDLLAADPAEVIARAAPSAVVNAAAYTAVDRAEAEPDLAYRLNRDAVGSMAQACAALDVPFVHISTDYVFDGEKPTPYVEADPVRPLSVYGRSKAEGEAAVAAAGGRWTILRTAWVFSPVGANFIATMLRLGRDREEVSVVADQWGRPTLAADVAAAALLAAKRSADGDGGLKGIFHVAGADDAVWADVAEQVFEGLKRQSGRRPALKRITTDEYPTPARRPANSRLDTAKLQKAADWSPRPWRETVELCLRAMS